MIRRNLILAVLAFSLLLRPVPARADLFGGDVILLAKILAQAIQTVIQLRSILQTGTDTLSLLRDVNAGVRSGLDLIRVVNPKFDPGVYGNLNDAESVLRALEQVYGAIPDGPSRDLIASQDQSVAEVISMNRNLYDFADSVDREKDRILFHASSVSPQGAGRLQNQALGVLIGVTTQLLRTQSQMLKLMAQNMAGSTRKEKLSVQSFQENYRGLSKSLGQMPKDVKLPKLGGAR